KNGPERHFLARFARFARLALTLPRPGVLTVAAMCDAMSHEPPNRSRIPCSVFHALIAGGASVLASRRWGARSRAPSVRSSQPSPLRAPPVARLARTPPPPHLHGTRNAETSAPSAVAAIPPDYETKHKIIPPAQIPPPRQSSCDREVAG